MGRKKIQKKERCPKCGQDFVLGLVVGFWAEVNIDPMEVRLEKASLITSKRQCFICDHQWDAGEIVEVTDGEVSSGTNA